MGLVWKVTEPDDLLPEARQHAEHLAAMPISSLVACKRVITEPLQGQHRGRPRAREPGFIELLGGPANLEAFAAFAEGRKPDFTNLPAWLVAGRSAAAGARRPRAPRWQP